MTRPPWRVEQKRQVERVLKRLPRPVLERIRTAIRELALDPYPPGYRKLTGYEGYYRVRVGDWRIVYSVKDEILVIVIVEVSPRGGAYKNL